MAFTFPKEISPSSIRNAFWNGWTAADIDVTELTPPKGPRLHEGLTNFDKVIGSAWDSTHSTGNALVLFERRFDFDSTPVGQAVRKLYGPEDGSKWLFQYDDIGDLPVLVSDANLNENTVFYVPTSKGGYGTGGPYYVAEVKLRVKPTSVAQRQADEAQKQLDAQSVAAQAQAAQQAQQDAINKQRADAQAAKAAQQKAARLQALQNQPTYELSVYNNGATAYTARSTGESAACPAHRGTSIIDPGSWEQNAGADADPQTLGLPAKLLAYQSDGSVIPATAEYLSLSRAALSGSKYAQDVLASLNLSPAAAAQSSGLAYQQPQQGGLLGMLSSLFGGGAPQYAPQYGYGQPAVYAPTQTAAQATAAAMANPVNFVSTPTQAANRGGGHF